MARHDTELSKHTHIFKYIEHPRHTRHRSENTKHTIKEKSPLITYSSWPMTSATKAPTRHTHTHTHTHTDTHTHTHTHTRTQSFTLLHTQILQKFYISYAGVPKK